MCLETYVTIQSPYPGDVCEDSTGPRPPSLNGAVVTWEYLCVWMEHGPTSIPTPKRIFLSSSFPFRFLFSSWLFHDLLVFVLMLAYFI